MKGRQRVKIAAIAWSIVAAVSWVLDRFGLPSPPPLTLVIALVFVLAFAAYVTVFERSVDVEEARARKNYLLSEAVGFVTGMTLAVAFGVPPGRAIAIGVLGGSLLSAPWVRAITSKASTAGYLITSVAFAALWFFGYAAR